MLMLIVIICDLNLAELCWNVTPGSSQTMEYLRATELPLTHSHCQDLGLVLDYVDALAHFTGDAATCESRSCRP